MKKQLIFDTVETDLQKVKSGKMFVMDFIENNFNQLYEKHLSEMPYGTAKARTGDPYNWLFNKYSKLVKTP